LGSCTEGFWAFVLRRSRHSQKLLDESHPRVPIHVDGWFPIQAIYDICRRRCNDSVTILPFRAVLTVLVMVAFAIGRRPMYTADQRYGVYCRPANSTE